MKDKLKYGILLLLIIFPFLTGCGKEEEKIKVEKELKYSDATPLLYKVTDGQTNLYLMGSIHAGDDTAYEFNKSILDIYKSSDALAVEFDVIDFNSDINAQMDVIDEILYTGGTGIKDELDEKTYNDLVKFLKDKKLYMETFDNYKPIFFESLVQNALVEDAGLDTNLGVDMYFLKKAKKDKKQIIEVESAEEQYVMMGKLPSYVTIESLKEVMEDYDEAVNDLKDLYNLWKAGNLEELEEIIFEEDIDTTLTQEEKALFDEYNKLMLTDRNINMTNVMEEYLNEGTNVFCVVGLAHIIGDGGMADLFTERGYTVELVDYSSK